MNPRVLQLAYSALKPFIFGLDLDAEHMHERAVEQIRRTIDYTPPSYSSLKLDLFGHKFKSPLLLAAGFDKYGVLVDHIPNFGFAGEVIGSITAQRSLGNPGKRLFRIPKRKALVNRMGLNNPGAEIIGERVESKRGYFISIAKTNDPTLQGDAAIADYVRTYGLLKRLGIGTEVDISCPTTVGGKTFQDPDNLELLLNALLQEGKEKQLGIKISPNLDDDTLQSIVQVADHKVDFYVATNTAQHHDLRLGKCGLSGLPLQTLALKSIRQLRQLTDKPIVGVGGIFTGQDAFNALEAGADLLQAYTGFVYRGPTFAMEVAKELDEILRRNGIGRISEIKRRYH